MTKPYTGVFAAATIAAIALRLIGSVAAPALAQSALRGTWRIDVKSPTSVDLELSYRAQHDTWDVGETTPFDEKRFPGLNAARMNDANAAVRFQIVRDAGAFNCEGYFSRGVGSGIFEYLPSAEFADALDSRGIGKPTVLEQFRLMLADVTLSMIDGLRSSGVTGLSVAGLVRLADHGVDADFVSGLRRDGYRPSVDDLIRLRDHGITTNFVDRLKARGYNPSVDELVRLADHGVDVDYIAGLVRYGYHPSADDLIRLRDHDVTLDFIAKLKAHGYSPSLDELIRLKDSGM